jgi:hypothetical protein
VRLRKSNRDGANHSPLFDLDGGAPASLVGGSYCNFHSDRHPKEFRSSDFKEHRAYIINSLKDNAVAAETGFRYLLETAKAHVHGVSHYFDSEGVQVANGVIGELLVISFRGGSIDSSWSVLEPYIRREREIRGNDYYPH